MAATIFAVATSSRLELARAPPARGSQLLQSWPPRPWRRLASALHQPVEQLLVGQATVTGSWFVRCNFVSVAETARKETMKFGLMAIFLCGQPAFGFPTSSNSNMTITSDAELGLKNTRGRRRVHTTIVLPIWMLLRTREGLAEPPFEGLTFEIRGI